MIQLKIKRLSTDAIIPRYATAGAACFDLHSISADTVEPGMACEFRTGLAVEIPDGHVMLVYSRSGNGFKYGVRLANCTGIIDSDYRGEIVVKLRNDGTDPLAVNRGARIAQAMVLPAPKVQIVEVDELTSTERGAGGFGSTGQ
jgi:deoxyuridine 5''-triphosphate nucleotidohydrolase (dut)